MGVVTTFLSDNPAILSLAEDHYFKSLFKRYQFPALTNLGTSFGMGLIVCTYMISLSPGPGESFVMAVLVGLLGAVVGSIVSTRIMLHFTAKLYGKEEDAVPHSASEDPNRHMRPIRHGGLGSRFMSALLDGGMSGVKMGFSIIPGVLIICSLVMMLTNGPSADGTYTGAAYEGVRFLPFSGGGGRAHHRPGSRRRGHQYGRPAGLLRPRPRGRHRGLHRHVHVLERVSEHPRLYDEQPRLHGAHQQGHHQPYHRRSLRGRRRPLAVRALLAALIPSANRKRSHRTVGALLHVKKVTGPDAVRKAHALLMGPPERRKE